MVNDVGAENWEDGNGDWLINEWFGCDMAMEGSSVVAMVFWAAELGTTVHILIAATEDEEGDCIRNAD